MAKLLLVDDHDVVRKGLRMLLEDAGHEIAAEASDAVSAVYLAGSQDFDLIIMDYSMPGVTGYEAVVQIRKNKPDSKILVLTMFDQMEYLGRAKELGVDGFLLKSSKQQVLLDAVTAILSGGKYFETLDHVDAKQALRQADSRTS